MTAATTQTMNDTQDEEEFSNPEVYTEEEMEAVEEHIEQYFGKFENVFHELVSPDIHVDICVVPPSEERDYCTLVTMGMGAHRMNVPEELAEYKLERAELAIALPADWKLDPRSPHERRKVVLAHLPAEILGPPSHCQRYLALGFGHTMDNKENFAEKIRSCVPPFSPGPKSTERRAARSAPCRAARRSTSIRSFRFMRTSWTINWNMM